MNPSYTIFHSSSETFSSIWTRFDEHFLTFYKDYQNDIKTYGEISGLIAKTNMPINNFNISMLPWTSFTGFNLNIPKSINYLLPIFTMGKYFKDNTKCLLPLSIQVHHAVCDGFHLCRFINSLQELIDKAAFIENINSEMT